MLLVICDFQSTSALAIKYRSGSQLCWLFGTFPRATEGTAKSQSILYKYFYLFFGPFPKFSSKTTVFSSVNSE